MIQLHKLKELPRPLRLRKSASLFGGAERHFILSGRLPPEEAEYLGRVAELLAEDKGFSEPAAEVLKAAQTNLVVNKNDGEIRRVLNSVYHILLAETGRIQADWDFIEPSGALDSSRRRPFPGMQVYLEDIRSPFNVGSMFRAAASFGVEKLWLSPLCADPRHKRAERTAGGCVDVLPWQRLLYDPFAEPVERKDMTFSEGPFFALETGGTPLEDFHFPPRGILIAGSEELGVSPRVLAAADASLGRITIPTRGAKGSLNVSVAFGIVMQAWAAQLVKI
ncbi:MAG: TrmH family RNA methyltransferase [Treponema sp.]|jgi:TrmH family RNA methyltransferase|nr:TrmH family RNA methyltransferase [Treponema sp.]